MKTVLYNLNSSAARNAIQQAMSDPHVIALAHSLNIDLNDEASWNSVVSQAEFNLEQVLTGLAEPPAAWKAEMDPDQRPRGEIRSYCVKEALHAYRAVAAI